MRSAASPATQPLAYALTAALALCPRAANAQQAPAQQAAQQTPAARPAGLFLDAPFELQPRSYFSLAFGLGGYTGGLATALHTGPVVQARAGLAPFAWLGFDANYAAMYAPGVASVAGEDVAVSSHSGFVSVRFTLPLRLVRPYLFAGVGGVFAQVRASHEQTTPMRGGAGLIAPVGLGVSLDVGRGFSIGAEGSLRWSVAGERLATDEALASGHAWSTSLAVTYELD